MLRLSDDVREVALLGIRAPERDISEVEARGRLSRAVLGDKPMLSARAAPSAEGC